MYSDIYQMMEEPVEGEQTWTLTRPGKLVLQKGGNCQVGYSVEGKRWSVRPQSHQGMHHVPQSLVIVVDYTGSLLKS